VIIITITKTIEIITTSSTTEVKVILLQVKKMDGTLQYQRKI